MYRVRRPPSRKVIRRQDGSGGVVARWTFLVTEHRRSALAIATLARSIFGDEHRPREIDLVSLMAQQAEDPPVEYPPNGEPPAEDPLAKEPPIEELGKPAPMKSA